MTGKFDISAHDARFAPRTNAEDWARILAFRNHPHFLDGVRRHEGLMRPFFANNLILNKVAVEFWRFQLLVFTLYLHSARDFKDPRTGLTLSNLQKICTRLALASPGRVYAFLNIMRLGGYLTSVRSRLDTRVVHLEPTPIFMATVEEWNEGIFESIDAAYPQGELQNLSRRHLGLAEGMRISGAEALLGGWQPLDPFPEVFHFAAVDGGWMLLEHIVSLALRHPDGITLEPTALDMRRISKQFGGSRSNLLRVLETGHELGLLDAPPASGKHILFSSRTVCAYIAFIASFLSFFQDHTMIALRRIEAREAARR